MTRLLLPVLSLAGSALLPAGLGTEAPSLVLPSSAIIQQNEADDGLPSFSARAQQTLHPAFELSALPLAVASGFVCWAF